MLYFNVISVRHFRYRFQLLFSGWTCRQQFEETWMSLLGVLNPVPGPDDGEITSDVSLFYVCQIIISLW